ncbi:MULTISPECIES: hypothetical protein [Spirulina sp. CCY15215]|uniref:hypothetical protein n=1 Tax=Spirulina sp. CCY15215 TaxID=2767591 RepID=UPI0019521E25|nr:hypothetical protein [Spirulina major]
MKTILFYQDRELEKAKQLIQTLLTIASHYLDKCDRIIKCVFVQTVDFDNKDLTRCSWQGGMSKAEALRQGMLATQAQFPNPKNWAALAIVGTGD